MIISKYRIAVMSLIGFLILPLCSPSFYATATSAAAVGINLFRNGGFEEAPAGDVIPNWGKWLPSGNSVVSIDVSEKYSGRQSLSIVNDSPDDRAALTQLIEGVSADKPYLFTYWFKSEEVTVASGGYLAVRVSYKNSNNQNIGNWFLVGNETGTHDWKKISKRLVLPAGTTSILFEAMLSNAVGSVWFDDFTLEEQNPGQPYIENAGFDDSLSNGSIPGWGKWLPSGNSIISIDTETAIEGQSVKIANDSPDDRGVLFQRVDGFNSDKAYLLTYWFKSQDVELSQGGYMAIRVQFKNSLDQNTGGYIMVGADKGTHEWTRVSRVLNLPFGTTSLIIEPSLSNAVGTVWYDSLSVQEIDFNQPPNITNVAANVLETGAVQLSWQTATGYSDAVHFEIYRSSDEDFEPAPDLLIGTSRGERFLDRNTALHQAYTYKVLARMSTNNTTTVSGPVTASIGTASAPNAVESLQSYEDAYGGAMLTWSYGGLGRASKVRIYGSNEPLNSPPNPNALLEEKDADGTTFRTNQRFEFYGVVVADAEGGTGELVSAKTTSIFQTVSDQPFDAPYLLFHRNLAGEINQRIQEHGYAEQANQKLMWNANDAVQRTSVQHFTLPEKGNDLHQHLSQLARDSAVAYLLTERMEFRNAAISLLMNYAEKYPSYPLYSAWDGRVLVSTLVESEWLINMAWAYDMMKPHLSEEQCALFEKNVLTNGAEVVERYKFERTNWQVWHNAAMGVAALAMDDLPLLNKVMNDPEQGIRMQFDKGIYMDGMWWEEASSYHEYVLMPLLLFAESAYNSNWDLFSHQSDKGLSMKTMLDAYMNYIYSDMTSPAIGDIDLERPLSSGYIYEIGYKHYKDPNYAWLIRQTLGEARADKRLDPHWAFLVAEPDLPNSTFNIGSGAFAPSGKNIYGSTLFEDSGLAILRSNTKAEQALNSTMTWSPYGTTNGHQHSDMLSITMYANGETLLNEAGRVGYDSPLYVSWAKQTLSHNTLVVDQTTQYPQGAKTGASEADTPGKPSSGELTHIQVGSLLKTVSAKSDKVYEGVMLERSLLQTDDYIVDWMKADSDAVHQYDLPYHVDGQLIESSLSFNPYTGQLGASGGYQLITGVSKAETDGLWNATWQGNENKLQLTMFPETGNNGEVTEVFNGKVLKELMFARREGQKTSFFTILQPYGNQKQPFKIEAVPMVSDTPGYAAKITKDNGIDYVAVGEKSELKTVGKLRFDGTIGFLTTEKNGAVTGVSAAEATYISSGDMDITLASQGSLQLNSLDNKMTRIDYEGQENSIRLSAQLHPNTKVMVYNPNAKTLVDHPIKLVKGKGALRDLQFQVSPGMSYFLIEPPYRIQLEDHDLTSDVKPLYKRNAMVVPETTGQVIAASAELEGIIVEGEHFSNQGGGQVVVEPKPGASGGLAFKYWDNPGHWLEWEAEVPEEGNYQIVIRYSTGTDMAYRELVLDGEARHSFHFPNTYGWNNWSDVFVADKEGQPLSFRLAPGTHTIYMMNLSTSLNIDYIKLVRAEE